MSTTEIKFRKSGLIINLTIVMVIILSSLYFLFFTDSYPENYIKVAGVIAAVILLYPAWILVRELQKNATQLLITIEKIGFYERKDWKEISLSSINSYKFKNYYNGRKRVRQLMLELSNGEMKAIELNKLDITQAKLEHVLNSVIPANEPC